MFSIFMPLHWSVQSGEESGKKSHFPYSNLKFCAGESQILENSIGLKYNNIFLAVLVFWDFFSPDRRAAGSATCAVTLI